MWFRVLTHKKAFLLQSTNWTTSIVKMFILQTVIFGVQLQSILDYVTSASSLKYFRLLLWLSSLHLCINETSTGNATSLEDKCLLLVLCKQIMEKKLPTSRQTSQYKWLHARYTFYFNYNPLIVTFTHSIHCSGECTLSRPKINVIWSFEVEYVKPCLFASSQKGTCLLNGFSVKPDMQTKALHIQIYIQMT